MTNGCLELTVHRPPGRAGRGGSTRLVGDPLSRLAARTQEWRPARATTAGWLVRHWNGRQDDPSGWANGRPPVPPLFCVCRCFEWPTGLSRVLDAGRADSDSERMICRDALPTCAQGGTGGACRSKGGLHTTLGTTMLLPTTSMLLAWPSSVSGSNAPFLFLVLDLWQPAWPLAWVTLRWRPGPRVCGQEALGSLTTRVTRQGGPAVCKPLLHSACLGTACQGARPGSLNTSCCVVDIGARGPCQPASAIRDARDAPVYI